MGESVHGNSNQINLVKQKDPFWQWIRGICIIAVVLIHCKSGIAYENLSSGAWNYDYGLVMRQVINFPVALFIFLSGYFTNIESVRTNKLLFYIKRGERLLLPFLVWSTFYTIVNVFLVGGDVDILKTIAKLFLGLSSGQLYFFLVLIQLIILTPLLIKTIESGKSIKALMFITPLYLLIIYSYTAKTGEQMPYYHTFFPAWFCFYFYGLWVKIRGWKPVFKNRQLFYTTLCGFAALLISIFEGYILPCLGFSTGFAYSQIKVSSFIYVFTIINLLMTIKPYTAGLEIGLLKRLGSDSFGIYLIHVFWLMIVSNLMQLVPAVSDILPAYQIVQLTLIIVLSVFSIWIARKVIGVKHSSKLLGF